MEAPLQEQEKVSMAEQWTRRYNLHMTMYMDPADSLVADLDSCGKDSLYLPREHAEHGAEARLAGGISITVEEAPDEVVRDVFAYYCSLRVLANAAAKAGNFEVESKIAKDTRVYFAPCEFGLCRSCLESHTAATRRAAGDAFVVA